MTVAAFKDTCYSFALAAQPYLYIADQHHYEETLQLIENLLEEADDSKNNPINAVIELLSQAVETYENNDKELVEFENYAMAQSSDLTVLRVLMDQHALGTADLPEIGSKSMVSRVLSGQRSLNKNHIKALSERFNLDPALFF
ncbi:MAG: transcriptional regulator [Gammaproteobacteria bacterium]|nr:MAG: transcriptional regulator [Gammaproteobacteria bacterium]